jgi:hypothetical protein
MLMLRRVLGELSVCAAGYIHIIMGCIFGALPIFHVWVGCLSPYRLPFYVIFPSIFFSLVILLSS